MDPLAAEWLNLALRWIHMIVGIAWIGSSFYFIWQDNHLRPNPADPEIARLQGEVWMVHGGGFYHVRKFLVAPPKLPDELHWFKWEAYATWISGISLLVLVYFLGASTHLLPPDTPLAPWQGVAIAIAALGLSWAGYDALCRSPLGARDGALALIGFVLAVILCFAMSRIFSGRGTFMMMGAVLGSIMAINVFMIIIPGQKIMFASLVKGEPVDPVHGKRAKQRSLHNNYLTLPTLFAMISNHFPSAYTGAWNWAVFAALAVIGAGVRHYFNLRHRGNHQPWILPLAAAALIIVGSMTRAPSAPPVALEEPGTPPPLAQAIVQARCVACHATKPTHPDFPAPPAGAIFDTLAMTAAWADKIKASAIDSDKMPLGNLTGMSAEERVILGRWIAEGARTGR